VKLVKDALAGIGARFYLVGIYTLLDLLNRMAESMASKDEDWAGAFIPLSLLALGIEFTLLGLVYHAAVDDARATPPSPARLGLVLFGTLLWLQIRLQVLVYAPIMLGAWGWHLWRTPQLPAEALMKSTVYWIGPFAEASVLLLLLVATPVAIWLREHGRRGAPIRDGVRLFWHRWTAGLMVAGIVAPAVLIDSALHYLAGPDHEDIVPTIPECLSMILMSYLTLVALFAASRVVVWSARTTAPEPRPADPAATAPGPPA
jgi:hypothetical protein